MHQSELDDYQYSGEHPWRDEETLHQLYIERELTAEETAEQLGCSRTTVKDWLSEYDIKRAKPWRDEDRLRGLYVQEELSTVEIADKWECSPAVVRNWLHRHGISPRTGEETRRLQYLRSGDMCIDMLAKGYKYAESSSEGERNRVLLHRLLAVAEYGFEAVKDMQVHHAPVDIPWANWPENIQLVAPEDHPEADAKITRARIYRRHRDEDVLRDMYWGQGLNSYEVADELGTDHSTVLDWMERHDIPRR